MLAVHGWDIMVPMNIHTRVASDFEDVGFTHFKKGLLVCLTRGFPEQNPRGTPQWGVGKVPFMGSQFHTPRAGRGIHPTLSKALGHTCPVLNLVVLFSWQLSTNQTLVRAYSGAGYYSKVCAASKAGMWETAMMSAESHTWWCFQKKVIHTKYPGAIG